MKAIKKFQIDTETLSDKEKLILDKLTRACELVAPLYAQQKNPAYEGANFYSQDATREEIQEAAKKNPLLLHPYTFVERDRRGGLRAVPFCVKFKKELKEIAQLIGEAAKLSEDKEFAQYLQEMARALLKNDYGRNEILWVAKGPFRFNFIIGPIERYLDRLFFRKCAYQAWLGISDEPKTSEGEQFKKIILAGRRKILTNTAKVDLPKLGVEINKTACFAGLIADNMFTGTNLPNDTNLMEKHGSKLTIFDSSLSLNLKQKNLPIFRRIFNKNLQEYFSEEELRLGLLRCVLLHEISHSIIRYRDAEERLKELFPIFDELLAYVLGIKSCGLLILKNALEQKELEAIMSVFLARNFRYWMGAKKNPGRIQYAIGAAIAQNFFTKEGALGEENGFCVPDFVKLFISIDHLSRVVEYYLSSGDYEEAKRFVDEHDSLEIFEQFSSKLQGLPE